MRMGKRSNRAKALTLMADNSFRCGCGALADVALGGDDDVVSLDGACARGCEIAIMYIVAEKRCWTTDENGARRVAHIYTEKKSHARG